MVTPVDSHVDTKVGAVATGRIRLTARGMVVTTRAI